MRLLFAARALDRMAGGVERMVIALANEMADRGHQVALFTWDRAVAEAFYPISSKVTWIRLDLGDSAVSAGILLRLRRAIAVRRHISAFRPDVITAFQGGAFKALSLYCAGLKIPIIAAERNAPTLYDHTSAGDKGRQDAFNAFRKARYLVVQCEAYRPMHPEFLQPKLLAIPNPVYPATGCASPDVPSKDGRFRLLAVGRLAYQKNYDCLIEAFARLQTSCPLWDLHILGEGEDRGKLEAYIRRENLSARVFLLGSTKTPSSHYLAAHLFCMASRWEGFPNALAEALAHGLPAVGFAESAGVNVLIEHGRNGLLARGNGDVTELAGSLSRLMGNPVERRSMGVMARASTMQYSPEVIMDKWETVFSKVIA